MKIKSNSVASTRKQQGKTQQELANYLGCSRAKLSLIETRLKDPGLVTALKIATFLNVPVDELFTVKD